MSAHLGVNLAAYETAVWLHNIDRVKEWEEDVKQAGGVERYTHAHLTDHSPFSDVINRQIAYAVANHSQKDCRIGEHPWLLVALMDADKMVRLFPLNVVEGAAHQHDVPLYNPEHPFDYRKAGKCLLRAFMWNLEWYGMLSCDESRALVDKPKFLAFINYIRAMGADIAEREGVDNRIENEIMRALGDYYGEVMG